MLRYAFALLLIANQANAWRSTLYPEGWKPGFVDAQGRGLHDFSHAGYHAGEKPLPAGGTQLDVTTFGADPTGAADSTAAIQRAIDEAGAAGGGVVYLPPGTYRVKPPAGAPAALYIGNSGVVLRGAGATQTFVFNDEPVMREKRIILVRPELANHTTWYWGGSDERALASDAASKASKLAVDTTGLAAGDWIVVRADPTTEFIADHGMAGAWIPGEIGGPIFYRRIVAVGANELELDVPLRYPLRVRDHARIHRIPPHLEEIGIEHLSIGNRQNTRAGTSDDDHANPGTGGYEMHNSFAIYFTHVVNGWVRGVATYRPSVNTANVHVLSNVLRLDGSRFVTVTDCDFRRPQYRGAGGNGYLYVMTGSENLVTKSYAEAGRHNYDFGLMYSSGSVVHRSRSKDARLPSDFHMHLSMANLYDNLTVDNDSIEAIKRDCCNHGHSTTESVIWNTEGARYPSGQILQQFIVDSSQFGHGYVVGTRGPATKVRIGTGGDTAPADWSEGIGMGDTLEPASLYEDQKLRRLGGDPAQPDGAPAAGDAGVTGDAGIAETQPGGCGCGAGGDPSLFLALLVLLRWRRSSKREVL
jgi:MYXO-CTERM domain-containing protein